MQSILIRLPGVAANGNRPLILPPPPPDPWTPAELPDLRGWWVPHDLDLEVGDAITSLPSGAGISNTLSQATGTRQPLYGLLNSKGAMNLDGTDDVMGMSDLTITNGAGAITMFFTFKLDEIATDTNHKYFAGLSTLSGSSTRFGLALNNTAGASKNYGFVFRRTDAGTTGLLFSGTAADTGAHALIATLDNAGSHLDLWLDGVHIYDHAITNTPTYWDSTTGIVATVGNRSSTLQSVDGLMSNLGIVRGTLTTDDRQKLEGYLAHYGGAQANLPVDHPYKAAPPTLE